MPRIERTARRQLGGEPRPRRGLDLRRRRGAFDGAAVLARRRASAQPEGKTSPEELLAAAHGGCFTMSLAGELTGARAPARAARHDVPDRDGRGRGPGAPDRRLAGDGRASRAPGLDDATLAEAVGLADEGCPFSALLKRAGASVDVTAELG